MVRISVRIRVRIRIRVRVGNNESYALFGITNLQTNKAFRIMRCNR